MSKAFAQKSKNRQQNRKEKGQSPCKADSILRGDVKNIPSWFILWFSL